MSKTVYVLLCWATFIPAMLALSAGVFWIRDNYGLPVIAPMAAGIVILGYLLHRWELKHGSLNSPRAEPEIEEPSSQDGRSNQTWPRG